MRSQEPCIWSDYKLLLCRHSHALYHTDAIVLLGAPTGSGKTISAQLTTLRAFCQTPHLKILYIAPLKVGSLSGSWLVMQGFLSVPVSNNVTDGCWCDSSFCEAHAPFLAFLATALQSCCDCLQLACFATQPL